MQLHKMSEEKQVVIDWLRRLGVEFQTGFLVINPESEDLPIVYANDAFYEMTGYSEEEVLGNNGRFLHGIKTDREVSGQIREYTLANKAGTFEIVNYRKDGRPFWNEITIQPLFIQEKKFMFTLLLQKDITERKRAEALIKIQQDIYTGIEKGHMLSVLLQQVCDTAESFFADGAKCTVLMVDEQERFRIAAGKSMPEEFHQDIDGLQVEADVGTCGAAFHRQEAVVSVDTAKDPLWEKHRKLVKEFHLASSWSVPITDTAGNSIGAFAIYFSSVMTPAPDDLRFLEQVAPSVALAVKYSREQEEVLRLAYIDKETGLSNRNYFMNELTGLLEEGKEGFVAFISLDEYVKVVDQYGHREGDLLIREIGRRFMRDPWISRHFVARFSDSTIAFVSLSPLKDLTENLERIKQCVEKPVSIQDLELFMTMKMGIALITPNRRDGDELIRHADSALSKAKLGTGESICYFEDEHDQIMRRDLRLASELTAALNRGEVDVHLQPKVELKTGEIVSFEALARWDSPELGPIGPNVFIPAAEKNGKIRVLEQKVFLRVMEWLKKRQDRGQRLRPVAINISAEHFFHRSFIPYLVDTAAEYDIDPKWIRLEITERIGFVDIDTAYKVFKQLNDYGFTSSVDDFGTGYSSLSYLQKLPVSEIKIDRSFISNMEGEGTLAIVRTIIQLAENLNMSAVAEGIETETQRRTLLALGCRYGQGYLFHKPMPLDEANLL
ncbi:EAL domain-containing protein [Planococcus salinus]|uniref:Phosphodiesterase n=1 Tax=Planococcus salinus TaxID=1848460 RepID=A0A3M8P9U2_9BACL|nr:EAL domain-containing protein [Planococcus salinus]RNF40020.1 phosphodiesterase [Planococcus salinus]